MLVIGGLIMTGMSAGVVAIHIVMSVMSVLGEPQRRMIMVVLVGMTTSDVAVGARVALPRDRRTDGSKARPMTITALVERYAKPGVDASRD